MGRTWGWVFGLALGLVGFLAGRAVGPSPVQFPPPGEARSAEQMETEVRAALLEPRAFPRAGALIRLFEDLSVENVSGATRAVTALAGRTDPVDMQLFLSAWILLDPLAAVQEIQRWPVQTRREIGLITSVREWAASGRTLEAANYVQSITAPSTRRVAAGPLVRGWALAGDDGALLLARRLWESDDQLDVVDGLVRGLLHTQGAKGIFRVASEVDPRTANLFDQRLVRVSLNLGGLEDPQAAARFYEGLVEDGEVEWLAGSLKRIAGVWRNEHPDQAVEWLLTLRESSEQRQALTETLGTWAIRDLDAAWHWFEQRTGGLLTSEGALSEIDSALLTGLVRRMARTDPQRASIWVLRIQPGADRQEMIRRVAYFWSMQDTKAASTWIAGLALEPEARRTIEQAAEWGRNGSAQARLESDDSEALPE